MPEAGDSPSPPSGASALHGRRKGKKLRSYQAGLFETLLPRLAVDPGQLVASPGALFQPAAADVWLEIGFGGGEHLAAQAERHPGIGFIGCEPFVNGVAKILAEIDSRALGNIRLHADDAGLLIDRLPDASIARVYLLYPDPWPKRRQRKRRFVSAVMLDCLARIMKPGAELRFATDIDDYAGWVLARVLGSRHFSWTARCAADWLAPWQDWPGTRYEAKAFAEGRRPAYFTFVRDQTG